MDVSRTKIVATLGPASSDPRVLETMIRAGLSVARVNMSHGTHGEHAGRIAAVRAAAAVVGRPVGILQDLCGPKIRTGAVPGGAPLVLEPGDTLVLVSEGFEARGGEIPTSYPRLHMDVKAGEAVLLSDGKLRLRAEKAGDGRLWCRVEEGGELPDKQGINLPGSVLNVPALSDKDRRDLAFGVDQAVDYVALSFVRTLEDVETCKAEMARLGSDAPLVAKIEKPEAVNNLDAILRAAGGVMVARGDLAVEVSTQRVPLLQKEIIHHAGDLNRIVITATQMLESMIEKTLPTRAEAADVANAVLDGTDALMLSGETAVGRHPAACVRMMASIAAAVEQSPFFCERDSLVFSDVDDSKNLSIAHAAFVAAREYKADALVVFTESGSTALVLSKFRPRIPIFALTPSEATLRRLALVWGTEPVAIPPTGSVGDMIRVGEKALLDRGLVRPDAKVIVTAGAVQAAGGTDMLKVSRIGAMSGA